MNNKLEKQYNGFAEDFSNEIDRLDNISRAAFYSKITNLDLKNKNVLDMACGDGSDLVEYEKRGGICFGCDTSENLIDLAKQKSSALLSVQDMRKTNYKNDSFDIVLSKYAIGTAENVQEVFDEVARVLKPGGIFVYLTTHPMRLFLENPNKQKDYFIKENVPLVCFGGKFTITEPSHTFNDFLNKKNLSLFTIKDFAEYYDPQSANFPGRDVYADFFIVTCEKK